MNWKDFLYFSKGERRALTVLLCLIALAWLTLMVSDYVRMPEENLEVAAQQTDTIRSPFVANPIRRDSFPLEKERTPPSQNRILKTKPEREQRKKSITSFPRIEKYKEGTVVELNSADTTVLKKVPGIGSAFSNRIVKYRNLLGGFYHVSQLQEVYGITSERYEALRHWFVVDSAYISPLFVNHLPLDSLRKHPYVNYQQAKVLLQLRRQKGKLHGWENLFLLEEFSEEDREKLEPYFSFE